MIISSQHNKKSRVSSTDDLMAIRCRNESMYLEEAVELRFFPEVAIGIVLTQNAAFTQWVSIAR